MEFLKNLFTRDFMPHGACYLWRPEVLWAQVLSDALIALAYFAIPFWLISFVRQRRRLKNDIQFGWAFFLFAAFIFSCGATHLMDIVTVWYPMYRFQAVVKIITACISAGAALALVPLLPRALAVPSRSEVDAKNKELQAEIVLRNKTEEELRRSNSELDNFAYVASHDLKSPLRAIRNLAEWIAEDSGDRLTPESGRDLELMQQRVGRLELLLDSLLQYSRVGRMEDRPENVDVKELVQGLSGLLEKPPDFTIVLAGDMPSLHAPRGALNRVFGNLIGNAIKHRRSDGAGRVEIGCRPSDGGFEFSIADNGPGIDPKYHGKIFQLFQTLKPRVQVEGSGMGLAIVKKTVETHGGRIWLESAEGAGCNFHLFWPQAGGSVSPAMPQVST